MVEIVDYTQLIKICLGDENLSPGDVANSTCWKRARNHQKSSLSIWLPQQVRF
jgi:hypothetical protein